MRKLKNELWLSAPLLIVNAPLERVVFSAMAQGRKASQINSQMAAVQCGAPSFIPHLQDSSMARPPTPLWCAADGQCFRTLVTAPCSLLHWSFSLDSAHVTSAAAAAAPGVAHAHAPSTLCFCQAGGRLRLSFSLHSFASQV